MEDELIRREERRAQGALDALGAGRVVPGRVELTLAAPGALMENLKREVIGQLWRRVVAQEALAESLGLAFGDHAAASAGDGHGSRPTKDLKLNGSTLDAGDAEGDASVVDLVVAEALQ